MVENAPAIVVRVQPTPAMLGLVWIGTTGYWVSRMRLGHVFTKFSAQGGEKYMVQTRGGKAVSCTCPDAKYRRRAGGCKHMRAASWLCEIEAHTIRNRPA